jgi:peptidoglycan hydrolase CwlO-like protein
MEEWITKFDIKYSSISEAFRKQLELIVDTFQLRGENIDERFNVLYSTLDKTIRDDLMATKNALKAENEAYLVEARQVFAYNAKELEKRMNQLEKKEKELAELTKQYRDFCQQMLESIEAIKEACLGIQRDLETLYTEMVALKSDMDRQLETIRTRFGEMQNDFEKAQSNRATEFNNSQTQRDVAYNNAENTRNATFNTNETNRQANETTRQTNEQKRIEDFNAMREEFNIALQYRLLEE